MDMLARDAAEEYGERSMREGDHASVCFNTSHVVSGSDSAGYPHVDPINPSLHSSTIFPRRTRLRAPSVSTSPGNCMDPILTALLQSNEPLDASQARHVRATLDATLTSLEDLEGQISKTLRYLVKLENQRSRRSQYADTLKGALSPIRRIPSEILVEIFLACRNNSLTAFNYSVTDPREAPMLMGHVSSRWRQACHGAPRLWDHPHPPKFTPPSTPKKPRRKVFQETPPNLATYYLPPSPENDKATPSVELSSSSFDDIDETETHVDLGKGPFDFDSMDWNMPDQDERPDVCDIGSLQQASSSTSDGPSADALMLETSLQPKLDMSLASKTAPVSIRP
ncbi:hypothetical protein FB451DRAFT_1414287 [Mycena latifolia]|nr:hypothetical protein FB451DRAFT_1414287 [Mycena latifolia]